MPIPEITEEFDTLYSTTWQLMRDTAVDNIFKATPFWYYMQENDRTRTEVGGRWIGVQLEYATHSDSVAWIGRSHDLSDQNENADKDIITTARYDWRYLVGSLYRSYIDDSQNRGEAAMMSIVDRKLSNMEKTLASELEARLFTKPDSPNGDEINSLEDIIQDDPTTDDELGGINQADNDWWRNQYKDMSDLAPSVNLLPEMRTMYNDCSVGADTPDVIVTSQQLFEFYEDEVLEFKQIVNKDTGDASFESIKFKGKDLVWSPSCPEDKMYFVNTDYLEWVADRDINFDMTDWKEAQGDLDRVAHIITMGNLVTSNRRMLGVMFNVGE